VQLLLEPAFSFSISLQTSHLCQGQQLLQTLLFLLQIAYCHNK
jgi:hypothetical protein